MTTSKKVKVYNVDEIEMTFGPVIFEGFAAGSIVTVEQESDDVEDEAGSDGEVVLSRTNDQRGTITVKLLQTSDSNDGLSVLHNLTRTAPGMAGAIHPFTLRDRNGRLLVSGPNTWVAKGPDIDLDKTAKNRDWKLRTAHLARFDGGS